MSFLSDLFEGNFSNLGTDITHAPSSLMNHPSELYETLGGAAALATGGLALGALPELGAASAATEGGGMLGGLFGGGADAAALAADPVQAALDAGVTGADLGADTAAGFPASFGGMPSSAATFPDLGAAPGTFGASDAAVGPLAGGTVGPDYGAATGSAGGGWFDTLTSPSQWSLGGVAKGAGVLAAGAGLGMNLLRGNPTDPNQKMLSSQAALESQQGQQLMSYLRTGKLPPALQAQLTQATNAEKTRIIANAAHNGQSTDPAQNSALAQELNSVDTNAVAAMAQVQMEMLNTGLKETGMSTEIYNILTKLDMQQNEDLMKSIMSFAGALSGGGGGTTIKLGA